MVDDMTPYQSLVEATRTAASGLPSHAPETWAKSVIRFLQGGPEDALLFAALTLEKWTGQVVRAAERPEELVAIVNRLVRVPAFHSPDNTVDEALHWLDRFDAAVGVSAAQLATPLSHREHTTLPAAITRGALMLRAGKLKAPPHVESVLCAGESCHLVHFEPNVPRELVFVVPVPADIADRAAAVRQSLSGSVLRTWWATWALAFERDPPDGFFVVDMRRIVLDLFERRPDFTTTNGKRYARVPSDATNQVRAALSTLERTLVAGVGEITVDHPEPLVHRYGVMRRGGVRIKGGELYGHARLAWAARRSNFVQLPRAAFRLDADDVALGMGLASVLRDRVREWAPSGALSLSLASLALQVGEDIDAGARRDGLRYWSRFRERLSRVAKHGGFGRVWFGPGDHGSVVVTLDPWPPLASAYASYNLSSVRLKPQMESGAAEPPRRRITAGRKRG